MKINCVYKRVRIKNQKYFYMPQENLLRISKEKQQKAGYCNKYFLKCMSTLKKY